MDIHRKHGGQKPSSSCSQPKKAKLLGESGKKHAMQLVVTTAPDAIALDLNEKKIREELLKVYYEMLSFSISSANSYAYFVKLIQRRKFSESSLS